jgi:predicted DsbA family dithiol-disulfide isomerase
MSASKPELLVTVFVDYVCPFCYIAEQCLERLREHYDLKVHWCFLEIQPDTPVCGQQIAETLSDMKYSQEEWKELMCSLTDLGKSEGVQVEEETFTTNSHKALLLAEAAKEEGREVFYALHHRIFEAFVVHKKNIAEQELLRELARQAGMPDEAVERAWSNPLYEEKLNQYRNHAQRLGVTGTPTFIMGGQFLTGALTTEVLMQAAKQARAALRIFI